MFSLLYGTLPVESFERIDDVYRRLQFLVDDMPDRDWDIMSHEGGALMLYASSED